MRSDNFPDDCQGEICRKDLIEEIGILITALASLIYQIFKGKK